MNALGKSDIPLTPQAEYIKLAREDADRLAAYRSLFKAHMDEEMVSQIRSSTNGNFALGSKRFQQEIEQALKQRVSRGVAGWPRHENLDDESQGTLI